MLRVAAVMFLVVRVIRVLAHAISVDEWRLSGLPNERGRGVGVIA